MRIESMTIPSSADALPLSVLLALPDDAPPRAMVQIAHGMAEHKQRYLPFMEALAEAGYASLIHDHRGHGESVHDAADLGYLSGADVFLADMRQLTDLNKARYPGLKLCLFGHSMGSLAARAVVRADDTPYAALVVSGSPSYNPGTDAGLKLVNILARIRGERHRSGLIDRLLSDPLSRAIPDAQTAFDWLNSDRASVDEYVADPLCGFKFTLNGHRVLMELMRRCYAETGWMVGNPELPVRFVSGQGDPCLVDEARFRKAVAHLRARGYRRVSERLFPGMRHEILQEPERATVFKDVIAFLDEHTR